MSLFSVSNLDNEESKHSYRPSKDMDTMIGGSPMRRKPLADDRRKSTLNIQSVKNKLVENTKKNMAKR